MHQIYFTFCTTFIFFNNSITRYLFLSTSTGDNVCFESAPFIPNSQWCADVCVSVVDKYGLFIDNIESPSAPPTNNSYLHLFADASQFDSCLVATGGIVLCDSGGVVATESITINAFCTVDFAELFTLHSGLLYLTTSNDFINGVDSISDVFIVTDSELALGFLRGAFKIKNMAYYNLIVDCFRIWHQFDTIKWHLYWVKGQAMILVTH